jgi:hypothetical protein
MKNAGQEALDTLESLLLQIRRYNSLKEKKRGIFYLKSSAFLPFHEDPEKLFPDLRVGDGWKRLPVTTKADRKALLAELKTILQIKFQRSWLRDPEHEE